MPPLPFESQNYKGNQIVYVNPEIQLSKVTSSRLIHKGCDSTFELRHPLFSCRTSKKPNHLLLKMTFNSLGQALHYSLPKNSWKERQQQWQWQLLDWETTRSYPRRLKSGWSLWATKTRIDKINRINRISFLSYQALHNTSISISKISITSKLL